MHFVCDFTSVVDSETFASVSFRLTAAVGFRGIENGDAVGDREIHQRKGVGLRNLTSERRAT
jgi:hypothetical protein